MLREIIRLRICVEADVSEVVAVTFREVVV